MDLVITINTIMTLITWCLIIFQMVLTVVDGVGVVAAVVMVAVPAAKDVNMLNPAALAVEDILTQVVQVVERKLERFEYLPQ